MKIGFSQWTQWGRVLGPPSQKRLSKCREAEPKINDFGGSTGYMCTARETFAHVTQVMYISWRSFVQGKHNSVEGSPSASGAENKEWLPSNISTWEFHEGLIHGSSLIIPIMVVFDITLCHFSPHICTSLQILCGLAWLIFETVIQTRKKYTVYYIFHFSSQGPATMKKASFWFPSQARKGKKMCMHTESV